MKNLIFIIFMFLSVLLNAQDIIQQKNGEKISAKVIEITPELVKYKNFTNQDGPTYSVYKKEVKQITYENGVVDSFSADPVIPKEEKINSVFIDPRDNQKYKIVKIGEQVWLAENLKYESNQSWCYDNLQSNCDKYGRLYTYEAANNVCPSGWHLPSDDEWKKLEVELGMQNGVNETGWRGTSPGQAKLMKIGGRSGLNVELTGFRYYGGYENMDDNAYFWTSTLAERNNRKAFSRELKERASVKRDESDINLGYSVRCIEGNPKSENLIVPKDEKIDKYISNHERNYFSIGVGSGAATGYIGLKAEVKFGIKNFGLGVQYGMGFLPDIPHYSLGAKLYYRYFYLNTLICNDDSYDGFNQLAVLIGLEYPLSKNFNISGGLGYYTSDIPITWELGINYKIFK